MARASFLSFLVLAVPAAALAKPREGSSEIRVGPGGTPPVALVTFSATNGINHYSDDEGADLTVVGIQGGYGYFLTETFELGVEGAVGFWSGILDDSLVGFGVAPFFKFLIVPGDSVGFYAEGSPSINVLADGDSVTIWGFGISLGPEFFPTSSWSFRLGPQYQFYASEGDSVHIFGVGWRLSTYLI